MWVGVWGGFACTGELDSQVELYLVSGGSRSSRLVSVEIGSANVGGGGDKLKRRTFSETWIARCSTLVAVQSQGVNDFTNSALELHYK